MIRLSVKTSGWGSVDRHGRVSECHSMRGYRQPVYLPWPVTGGRNLPPKNVPGWDSGPRVSSYEGSVVGDWDGLDPAWSIDLGTPLVESVGGDTCQRWTCSLPPHYGLPGDIVIAGWSHPLGQSDEFRARRPGYGLIAVTRIAHAPSRVSIADLGAGVGPGKVMIVTPDGRRIGVVYIEYPLTDGESD